MFSVFFCICSRLFDHARVSPDKTFLKIRRFYSNETPCMSTHQISRVLDLCLNSEFSFLFLFPVLSTVTYSVNNTLPCQQSKESRAQQNFSGVMTPSLMSVGTGICHCWRTFRECVCPVLSCPVLSCPVLSCPVLSIKKTRGPIPEKHSFTG